MKKNLPDLFEKISKVYAEHGDIIIAVDFDDTIYDWKCAGFDCDYVVDLIIRCIKQLNAKVILFTCRYSEALDFAIKHCKEIGIPLYGINENPDFPYTSSKPFYNVLLDDKACLSHVCEVLEKLLDKN
jgi:hydroxymethylpyrimidine pyrophosphatase-like HAD family hydrolase